MRARRRVAAEAERGPVLLPAENLLAPMIEAAIAAASLSEQDQAAAQLALQLGKLMDTGRDRFWTYRWLTPELLKVLMQLGLTPGARKDMPVPASSVPNRLEALRAQRAADDDAGREVELDQARQILRMRAALMDDAKIAEILGVDELVLPMLTRLLDLEEAGDDEEPGDGEDLDDEQDAG